jgi:hypothetical protein
LCIEYSSMAKCGCKLDESKKGGSLASTNVVEFVPCEAWGKIEATNIFGGDSGLGDFRVVMEGGAKTKTKKSSSRWRKIKMPLKGGTGSCGDSTFTPSFLSATGNPPALSLPASQTSAVFDYNGVGQSVLATLQSQAVAGSLLPLPSQVYVPQSAASLGTNLYP